MFESDFEWFSSMTPAQVFAHFGDKAKTAKKLNISYQAVQQWEDKGCVPVGRQFEIQVLTDGKLKADDQQNSAA